jgi:hypothetical protein
MDTKAELERRLTEAVYAVAGDKKLLIGPKWLQDAPDGAGHDWVFVGAPKAAKALGRNQERTARGILKNLNVKDLNVEARLTERGFIELTAGK